MNRAAEWPIHLPGSISRCVSFRAGGERPQVGFCSFALCGVAVGGFDLRGQGRQQVAREFGGLRRQEANHVHTKQSLYRT